MSFYEQAQEKLDEMCGEISSSLDIDREQRLVTGLTDILGQNKVQCRVKGESSRSLDVDFGRFGLEFSTAPNCRQTL